MPMSYTQNIELYVIICTCSHL